MRYALDPATTPAEAEELFARSFGASEGPEEGALIGGLGRRMIAETPAEDLRIVTARDDDGTLAGSILFSRLVYQGDARTVFVMAPVAVAPDRQRAGAGLGMIAAGLDALRAEGVDIAVTYGDPAYYGRAGFLPVTEADLPAPHPLQFPEGWQAQSLTAAPLSPLSGPARCVPAMADPVFW